MREDALHVANAFSALLDNLSKPRQRLLYQQIGRELAKRQRQRIKAQQNPDGTAYTPRKPQQKVKGRIKTGAMFKKLRTPTYLKVRNEADGVSVGFTGRAAVIAHVHQYGLTSKIGLKGKRHSVQYAQRELLGVNEEEKVMIETLILEALTGK